MNLSTIEQQRKDLDQLRLLEISHYVVAGVSALVSCVCLIHISIGWSAIHHSGLFVSANNPPPPEFGWLFLGLGTAGLLLGWIYSALVAYTGRCIAKRMHRTFVLIMSGINCCHMPLGVVLGVLTFIVMFRDSVKSMFEGRPLPSLATAGAATAHGASFDSISASDEDVWKDLEAKAKQQQAESNKLNKLRIGEETPDKESE